MRKFKFKFTDQFARVFGIAEITVVAVSRLSALERVSGFVGLDGAGDVGMVDTQIVSTVSCCANQNIK